VARLGAASSRRARPGAGQPGDESHHLLRHSRLPSLGGPRPVITTGRAPFDRVLADNTQRANLGLNGSAAPKDGSNYGFSPTVDWPVTQLWPTARRIRLALDARAGGLRRSMRAGARISSGGLGERRRLLPAVRLGKTCAKTSGEVPSPWRAVARGPRRRGGGRGGFTMARPIGARAGRTHAFA